MMALHFHYIISVNSEPGFFGAFLKVITATTATAMTTAPPIATFFAMPILESDESAVADPSLANCMGSENVLLGGGGDPGGATCSLAPGILALGMLLCGF